MFSSASSYIRKLELEDIDALLDLRVRNKDFLKPFEPTLPADHFTYHAQEEAIKKTIIDWKHDLGYGFGIFLHKDDQLIGRVNLSNVSRGAWQNCTIGYFVDHAVQGKGLATNAVKSALHFAFNKANLHRVEAGVMPRNRGSICVLEKTGFHYIGSSKYHLKINGRWEDHHLYSITREKWNDEIAVYKNRENL